MKQLTARLGEEKISKLLVRLSLPATIGMMVTHCIISLILFL
ncbi:hypothetical protein ES708_21393 [subsurface metagenome]